MKGSMSFMRIQLGRVLWRNGRVLVFLLLFDVRALSVSKIRRDEFDRKAALVKKYIEITTDL